MDETFPKLPPDWCAAAASEPATLELYEEIRRPGRPTPPGWRASNSPAGAVKAGSVWDAVHLAAVELSARFDTRADPRLAGACGDLHQRPALRLPHGHGRPDAALTLLQAVCWVSEKMTGLSIKKGRLRDLRITRLEPADVPADTGKPSPACST